LLLAAAGCANRATLSPHQGESYRRAFQTQAVNPNAGDTAKTPKGLDSHEAAVIADSYRGSLVPKGTAQQNDQILLVTPSAAGGPAPTVSPGR
jgi:hypothetical protein